jgi:predicted nucleic acid-binding protein
MGWQIMPDYVYDTNIFIYHLNGSHSVNSYFSDKFLQNNNIYFSVITEIELLSYPKIQDGDIILIKDLLAQMVNVPLNSEVKDKAIQIRKKHKIKLPDAIIAATAIVSKAELITRNVDDYKTIENVKIINPF